MFPAAISTVNPSAGGFSTIAVLGVLRPSCSADTAGMGIRYYAYAFEADMTDAAVDYPRLIIGRDPLADAWGLPDGFVVGNTDFTQRSPQEDMLYLDKAWRELQQITSPPEPRCSGLEMSVFSGPMCEPESRSAYRMFEGHVHLRDGGATWDPWLRTITPAEVPEIAEDLDGITEADFSSLFDDPSVHDQRSDFVLGFLDKARRFVRGLEASGRGFVYMIG